MVIRRVIMNKYTESLFIGICEKLQLNASLYDQAVERYNVIANTINKDEIFENANLSIYPQGSFCLKTTVKPLSSEEYDLDFVAELPVSSEMTPQDLYNHIVRILSNDGIHNDMIEKKIDGNIACGGFTGRYYLPEEVAEVACFLLCDASNCLNGQILVCNEGKTINARWK